jgi:hypothetical protein
MNESTNDLSAVMVNSSSLKTYFSQVFVAQDFLYFEFTP